MIILSFLCTGIRAVNQEDLDSKEVPEMPWFESEENFILWTIDGYFIITKTYR